ncbi:MAG: gliding motility-associated C-terminal domain-containing protein [Flavobacteriales bacterium]
MILILGFFLESNSLAATSSPLVGGDCIEVLDPNTNLVSNAFVVDTVCQGDPYIFCLTTSGCDEEVEIISVIGNLGQVVVSPPGSALDFCISYTGPADFVGEDTFTLELTNTDSNGNVTGSSTVELTFVVADPSNPTTVSAPQELCSPANSTFIEAINPDPIVGGYWVILQGGGTIVDETSPVVEVTNLPFGESIFMWRQDYPCQSTFDLTAVTVYDGQAPVADAGEDQTLCSFDTDYTMQANDPLFSATGTWEITFGNATINDINDPNAEVTNLGIGCNIFEWNISNGPCPGGETVDQMIICVFDQNAPDADAGEDIELCAAASGNTSVTANAVDVEPFFPAVGTWSVIEGFGVIDDVEDPQTLIENLQIGTNSFVWDVENGDCPGFPQVDTLEIRVFDPNHAAPDGGPDTEYCAPIGSHNLSANLTTDPAVGTWTLINGSGSFSNVNDPNATVTNLSIGINTYRWSIDNGPCTETDFFDEVSITVYDSNVASAQAGNDITLCESDFTTELLNASDFSFPATGVWSVESPSGVNAADILSNITDPNAEVSGLMPNEYILRWTVNNGPCASGNNFDDLTILLFPDNQVNADAGEDTELCTPITSFNLNGNAPLAPGIGTWTLVSGGGAIADPNNPNSVVSNLGVGENVFRWTIENGGCGVANNFDEVTITVFNVDTAPANAGADQQFCSSVGATVTANMDANIPQVPAFGQWTVIEGSGDFSNFQDPNAIVSNLSIGVNTFQWTIDNGACDVLSNLDQVTIEVFNQFEPDADAGDDFEICSDQLSANLNASSPSAPSAGTWTVVQGSGVFADASDPNTEITGYTLGTNTYRWTINNGPCDPPSTFDDVILTVFNQDVVAANAGEDLEICNNFGAVTLNATSFTAPATGQWNVISGAGVFSNPNDPNSEVSSWDIGENIYEWSVNNGPCSGGANNDQITVLVFDINADQANAGEDQEVCTPLTSAELSAVVPSSPSSGFWTVVSGTGLFLDDTDPFTTVTGLSVGNNVFRWTIDNGACSPVFSEDDVVISLFQEGNASASAGSDQNLCEPINSTNLSANSPLTPSTGFWTLVSGSGTFNDPTDPNTQVSNLGQGINVLRWTVSAGPCEQGDQFDEVSINIFEDNHPAANAGDDIEECTPVSSIQLSGSEPVLPATGTWIQVSGPNSAIFDPNLQQTTLTNLIPGVYVFQWQIDVGPCDSQPITDQVIISIFDTLAPEADAGADIELCTPNTSTNLSSNVALGAASGTWTLINGSGFIQDTSDPNTLVSNLSVGLNQFVWTIDNGLCGQGLTSDTVDVLVFDSTSPNANAGVDQFLCTPQSTADLSGNSPLFPATVLWELVSGDGIIINPTSSNTGITGLTVGENIFSYTIFNGNCANAVTTDQVSIFVFDSGAPSAEAGADQELCSPSTTTGMSADPAVNPGIGTWSLLSGNPSVNIVDVNDANTAITNLSVGTYVFEWSLDYSTCGTQADQITITVFDSTLAPAEAGEDLVVCLPDNSSDLNATSVALPAFGTWSVVEGSGTFSDQNDASSGISNLSIGENVLVWTVYNGNCTAPEFLTDTVLVSLYQEDLPQAFAGEDQNICESGSDVITSTLNAAAPPIPSAGTWSLISGTADIFDVNDPNSTVTNLGLGVNVFQWTIDYEGCAAASSDQITINVFDGNLSSANAGPDQSFCTPVSSVDLAGNTVALPATGIWSQVVGTGVFEDPTDPNTSITNLSPGVTILRWTIQNGPCDPPSTNDLVTIFIYEDSAPNASVGEDQELCLPETSTNLSGSLPVFPGVGTWTQIEGTSSINNSNNPNSPVSNLSQGDNVFVWTVFNGPCANTNTTDTLVVSVFDPNSPIAEAGDAQNLCSFTTTASLSASVPISPGVGTWSQVLGVPADIADINDPNTSVSNLGVGINTFQWSIYNGPCENGISSDVVTVNVFDENQNESSAGDDQELCFPANSSSFSANALTSPAVGQWNLLSGGGTIEDIFNPTSNVSELAIGVNMFTWTVNNGACPDAVSVDTILINVFDPDADDALAIEDIQVCDPISSIEIAANQALNAAVGTWIQIQGDAIIEDINSEITEITNLFVGEYIFVWEINNGPCGTSTDTLVVEVFSNEGLAASAGDNQSYCTPVNTATLEGSELIFPAVGEWQILIGDGDLTDPTDPLTQITNLTVGETILSWTVDNGACGGVSTDFVSIFIFDDAAPDSFAGEDQEMCLPQNSANMTAVPAVFPAIGSWSLLSGGGVIENINSPNSEITELPVGENLFLWTVNNVPCENGVTMDTVSIYVFPNDFELANAGEDQERCAPLDSLALNALTPDVPSVGTWTLTVGSGSITDVNDPNTQVSQLGIGTNVFTWDVYHGPCDPENSVDQTSILVYDPNHPPADAGADQEICIPDNSVTLNALPTSDPATGNWSLISGGGTIVDINDPISELTGLPVGENCFVWTVDNGPCVDGVTTDTVCVRVFSEDADLANAGENINLCGESSVQLGAAIPSTPSSGTWSLISGPSSWSITDVTDPSAELSALVIGQYIFEWTVYNGPCVDNSSSSDQVIVNVYDFNQAPAFAGDSLQFCWPVSDIQLSADSVSFPSIGTWSLLGDGVFSDINDPNAIFSDTGIGEHVLTWTVDNGPCGTSSDNIKIEIFDPNSAVANAGSDQSICTDPVTGSEAIMTASVPTPPAQGTWITVFGSEPDISNVNDPNAVMNDFGFGETQLIWQINNGPCENGITTDTISIFHFDSEESDAFAGIDQDFCDIPDKLLLEANNVVGQTAIGSWSTFSQPEGSAIINYVDQFDETTLISGFGYGTYEFTWTVDNGECGITQDNVQIHIFDPSIPDAYAGEDQSICEDEFINLSPLYLEGSPVTAPATVEWSILSGNAELDQSILNTSNPEIFSLGELSQPLEVIEHTFLYTVNNGPCGSSQDTVNYELIDCLTIQVPDAFSPNGDFINDTWDIPNLNKYPGNSLMVFNRWGTKVFEATDYDGSWNGVSDHPATIGDELPVGTYYYVLDLGNGSADFKGYVYLKR